MKGVINSLNTFIYLFYMVKRRTQAMMQAMKHFISLSDMQCFGITGVLSRNILEIYCQ